MKRFIPLCLFFCLFATVARVLESSTIAAREEGIGEMFDPVREVVDGWMGGWMNKRMSGGRKGEEEMSSTHYQVIRQREKNPGTVTQPLPWDSLAWQAIMVT